MLGSCFHLHCLESGPEAYSVVAFNRFVGHMMGRIGEPASMFVCIHIYTHVGVRMFGLRCYLGLHRVWSLGPCRLHKLSEAWTPLQPHLSPPHISRIPAWDPGFDSYTPKQPTLRGAPNNLMDPNGLLRQQWAVLRSPAPLSLGSFRVNHSQPPTCVPIWPLYIYI